MLNIQQDSSWGNGNNESFNSNYQDELLKREFFMAVMEAKILVECWRYE